MNAIWREHECDAEALMDAVNSGRIEARSGL
jgi:hypothetical protein